MWIILLSIVVVILTFYLIKLNNNLKKWRNIPGPPQLPFIGNTLDFVNLGPIETFNKLLKLRAEYGEKFQILFGTHSWILYSNPKVVEVVVTSNIFHEKSDDYNFVAQWLGRGLLISTGSKWFTHRKALTPAFHFKILENFIGTFDEQADILADLLLKKGDSGKTVIDIFPMIKLYTLDVICETAMGTTCNAQTKATSYTESVEEIASILYWRMFNAFAVPEIGFWMTKNYKLFHNLVKTLHKFTYSIIEKRRDELVKNTAETIQDEKEDLGAKKKMALLDVLLQTTIDGNPLTNEEIREEVDTFMFAGHDTTASAISFLMYNMAKYPEIQQKAYEEIVSVVGDDKTSRISLHNLNDMKYLELVVKESLRILPPVPFIARRTNEEVELDGDILPAHTNITIGIYYMHHDPNYFPEPEKFIPERFDTTKENSFAYIPFSAGSRNCIGQKFAMYEVKSAISKILRHFKICLPHVGYEPIIKAEIVLKPATTLELKFCPR